MENEVLRLFAAYVVSKGHSALFEGDAVIIYDVANPGNDFKIYKADGYYVVITISVSEADYEYTAKCIIYLLLAEYNKEQGRAKHLYINYKVDL
jgi:hypothetical protein